MAQMSRTLPARQADASDAIWPTFQNQLAVYSRRALQGGEGLSCPPMRFKKNQGGPCKPPVGLSGYHRRPMLFDGTRGSATPPGHGQDEIPKPQCRSAHLSLKGDRPSILVNPLSHATARGSRVPAKQQEATPLTCF
jgi:hypothetical protein